VTVWYGAAQHVPNSLVVSVSTGNAVNTTVNYQSSSGLIALLTANGATTFTFAPRMNANYFTTSGFFQSVPGENGEITSVSASPTTFLSGGADAVTDTVTANYGYFVPGNGAGFFQMQPIIVGAGGSAAGKGGIGCGGGADSVGGPGLVLIASW
jgi:hypothetical protein